MTATPSRDVRAVVEAVDRLTTQVKRLADAKSTPVAIIRDGVTTSLDALSTDGGNAFGTLMAVPTPASVTVHLLGHPPLTGTWHGGGTGTPRGMGDLVWEPTITFPRQRPTDAPTTTADDGVKRARPVPYPREVAEDEEPMREYERAADEDAERTARRDSIGILLSRAGRGVLTGSEAEVLRQWVETEIRDRDQQYDRAERAVRRAADEYDRRQTAEQAAEEARAELEQAQQRTRQLETAIRAVLHLCGDQGSDVQDILRTALDDTDQPTTETL